MREIRSYGSVGERGGNEPLYPESLKEKPKLFKRFSIAKYFLDSLTKLMPFEKGFSPNKHICEGLKP